VVPAAKKAIKRTPVAPSKPAPAQASVIDPATPAHSAGMVIQIDPETGLIGPGTADATLETDPNFEGDGLVKVVMPDGSIMMDLEGRFQMYSTVTMGADGKPVFQCSPKPHPAHKSCAFPAQTVEE
jgi:hypothetical protein